MADNHDPVQELCEQFTAATGFLCSAEEDLDGQLVIHTGLRLNEANQLVDMETGEVVDGQG